VLEGWEMSVKDAVMGVCELCLMDLEFDVGSEYIMGGRRGTLTRGVVRG
jgi:hypothetical protein